MLLLPPVAIALAETDLALALDQHELFQVFLLPLPSTLATHIYVLSCAFTKLTV